MKTMNLLLVAAMLACTTSIALAADAPTPPQPTTSVSLTADDLQTLSASLNLATATCTTNPDGCVIGLRKQVIMAKLQTAFDALQKQAAQAKK